MTARDDRLLVGIVGPCGAGKTTLAKNLGRMGIKTRAIAQEHSYVPYMWQKITNPTVLVFLDASYKVTCRRRSLDWSEDDYLEQHHRLRHARQHANLYLFTDGLTPQQIVDEVLKYLDNNPNHSIGLDDHAAL
jgi:ABC-type glutathione transport system ATPase component